MLSIPSSQLRSIVSAVLILFSYSVNARSLDLSLQHTVTGRPLILDSLRYETSANEIFSISRLSYLLSEFELQSITGDWQAVPSSIQ